MGGRASKNKGSSYERKVSSTLAKYFKGHKFRRVPQSGAWDKVKFPGDIYSEKFIALSIECKNQKKINLRDWIKQSRFDGEKSGKDYCVIFHINRCKCFSRVEDFICIEKELFDYYSSAISTIDHTLDKRWSLDDWLVDDILIKFEEKEFIVCKLDTFLKAMNKRRMVNPVWHAMRELITV